MFRRFILKNKGSISIFLTIILLPMITFAGVIVDASRLSAARAMITSSGDLTMNAALADYDSVLKDVYGLFAMSQSAENPQQALQENLEKYFQNTLVANGIVPEDGTNYGKELLGELGINVSNPDTAQTFDNFMKFDINNFKASYVDNSSLANPKVMKREIVEYMKYRAPANIGLSFLDSLSAFGKMNDQTDVVNGKLDADNALEAVNEAASDYYDKLMTFNNDFNKFKDGYADFKNKADSLKSTYSLKVNRNVLVYLLFEEKAPDYYVDSYSPSDGSCYGYKLSNSGNGMSTSNYDSAKSSLTSILDNLDSNSTFKEKGQWLDDNRSTTNYKQYIIKFKENGYIDIIKNLNNAAYTCDKCYHDEAKAKEQEAEEAAKKNEENKDDPKYVPIVVSPPPPEDSGLMARVNAYMSQANSISNAARNAYTIYKQDIDARTAVVNSTVDDIQKFINDNLATIDKIIGDIGEANKAEDGVKEAVVELNKKMEEWKTQIDKYGKDGQDSFQQSMLQEWTNRQNAFNLDEVEKVKVRMSNDQSVLQSAKDELLKFKYGDTQLRYITNANDAKSAVKNIITSPIDTDNEADSKFGSLFVSGSVPSDTMKKLSEPETLMFYNYLVATFGVEATDQNKKEEDDKDKFCDDTTKQVKDSDVNKTGTMSTNKGDFQELPSKDTSGDSTGDTGKNKDAGSSTAFKEQSSIVSKLLEGLKNIGITSRDNLYVMDYAMNMFSCNTSAVEVENANKDITNEADKLVLKTLSGVPINDKNNYYYGSEIEYILYGNADPKDNVFTAKAQIFAIRFVCNSIYALTNSEIRLMTMPPAAAISAATLGIVPEPVVQVVLELALALAESTYDMKLMAEGKKVALFKDKTTWVMSVSGATNVAVKEITDKAKNAAEDAINSGVEKGKKALQDLIDSSGEQAKDMTAKLQNDLEAATRAKLEEAAGLVLTQYSTILGDKLQEVTKSLDESTFGNVDQYVDVLFQDVDNQVGKFIDNSEPLLKEVEQVAYDNLVSPREAEMKGKIKEAINNIRNSINSTPEKINGIINDALYSIVEILKNKVQVISSQIEAIVSREIDNVTTQLNNAASQGMDKAKNAMIDVTDKYLTKLGNSIPVGNGELGSKPSATQTLLSFGYKDYLKLFMFIKLCTSEDTEMKRIADLVQINICSAGDGSDLQHVKKDGFRMKQAYTYVEIQADVKLKTMFMNIPIITSYAKKNGIDYLGLNYKSLMGY